MTTYKCPTRGTMFSFPGPQYFLFTLHGVIIRRWPPTFFLLSCLLVSLIRWIGMQPLGPFEGLIMLVVLLPLMEFLKVLMYFSGSWQ